MAEPRGMKGRFGNRVQPEKISMSNRTAKKAPLVRLPPPKKTPIVRLPPKSNVELLLAHSAQVSLVLMGLVTFIFALHAGEYILAPITMGIVIGLMLGPVAVRLERHGVPCGLSAFVVTALFIGIVVVFALVIAAPLSMWSGRIPQIWEQLQAQLSQLKQPIEAIRAAREELRGIAGSSGVTVSVEDNSAVESMATLAPAVIAQILIFLASLYFFVATRHEMRTAILKVCFSRRLRWRAAHIFRDVETLVSRYLLSITVINVSEGVAVGLGLYAVGVQSAILWGALAAVANFIIFLGPLSMTILLFGVGLTEFDTFAGALVPPLVYQSINLVEQQFVTPMVIGRTMTMNPFIVVLALIFWIWLWGPLGGFIAVPALLIVYAVVRNIVPGADWLDTPRTR
jgi:predicted PurR-regulated permease PerM